MNIDHLSQRAARIAAANAPLQIGTPLDPLAATRPGDAERHPVEASARVAARMLGFIESDAEVIGRAWLARAQRTRPQGLQSPSLREPAEADQAELAWPDHPDDFGLPAWPRDGSFAPCPAALGLYVVAPDAQWIARLAQWGVPTVQLRFKPAETQAHGEVQAQVRAQVQAAVRAVEGTATRLFINDYWRIAMEEGAYGVHLGQEDLSLLSEEDLDRMRQARLRLGLSTHGYAEMLRAEALGPSYLAMGAVYPTTLKAMPTAPQGPHRLAAYARLMRDRSVVAIGGIDESRLDEVVRTGVGSVAVVRAVIGAPDPEAAVRSLMQRVSCHPSSQAV
jgi:thiamine-phosphate pyrophosphorylase